MKSIQNCIFFSLLFVLIIQCDAMPNKNKHDGAHKFNPYKYRNHSSTAVELYHVQLDKEVVHITWTEASAQTVSVKDLWPGTRAVAQFGSDSSTPMSIYRLTVPYAKSHDGAVAIGSDKSVRITPYELKGDSIRIAAVGDIGGQPDAWEVVNGMHDAGATEPSIDVALLIGDLFYGEGNLWMFHRSVSNLDRLPVPVAPVLGNHDVTDRRYFWAWYSGLDAEKPYYTTRLGPVRLFALCSQWDLGPHLKLDREAQLRWLRREMDAVNRTETPWVIAIMHHPVMTASKRNPPNLLMRHGLEETLLPGEVDLVLAGHNHQYERSFPMRKAEAGDEGFKNSGSSWREKSGLVGTGNCTALATAESRSGLDKDGNGPYRMPSDPRAPGYLHGFTTFFTVGTGGQGDYDFKGFEPHWLAADYTSREGGHVRIEVHRDGNVSILRVSFRAVLGDYHDEVCYSKFVG